VDDPSVHRLRRIDGQNQKDSEVREGSAKSNVQSEDKGAELNVNTFGPRSIKGLWRRGMSPNNHASHNSWLSPVCSYDCQSKRLLSKGLLSKRLIK